MKTIKIIISIFFLASLVSCIHKQIIDTQKQVKSTLTPEITQILGKPTAVHIGYSKVYENKTITVTPLFRIQFGNKTDMARSLNYKSGMDAEIYFPSKNPASYWYLTIVHREDKQKNQEKSNKRGMVTTNELPFPINRLESDELEIIEQFIVYFDGHGANIHLRSTTPEKLKKIFFHLEEILGCK